MGRKRIGAHFSTSGGAWTAIERAVEAGANTLQIFSPNARTWKTGAVSAADAAKMRSEREHYRVGPLVIHAAFEINLPSQTASIRSTAVQSLRAEVQNALAWGAEYLVLHPGSWKGLTREEGLRYAVEGVERAFNGSGSDAPQWQGTPLRLLIENAPGTEFSLGDTLEQMGELAARLRPCAPVDVCLDTCHLFAAGYDLATAAAYDETARQIGATVGFDAVRVWHCNDSKGTLGSRLDRHEHIGDGMIGAEAFRRLLHDERFAHAAFIAETPADDPEDNMRNVMALRALSAG